jgi:hypothetical protein
MTWPSGDAMRLRPELADKVAAITAKSADRMPGRLELLFSTRVAQLRGLALPSGADAATSAAVSGWPSAPTITMAERSAIDLLERFLLDIRSVDDQTFAALKAHYDDDEVAAILFRLALLDGFSKFNLLFPGGDA